MRNVKELIQQFHGDPTAALIGAAEEIVQADLNADYDSDAEDDTDDTKNG